MTSTPTQVWDPAFLDYQSLAEHEEIVTKPIKLTYDAFQETLIQFLNHLNIWHQDELCPPITLLNMFKPGITPMTFFTMLHLYSKPTLVWTFIFQCILSFSTIVQSIVRNVHAPELPTF
jgi:hypothetical protein